ncbi:glutamate decarboxylase, partial [Shigella flexneri]|nr:glutamate decarboxylase [Shigella flexneri]
MQICWHKFCRCCDVKLRKISLYDHRLIMNAEEVLKHVDENTIGIVTTLGITCF